MLPFLVAGGRRASDGENTGGLDGRHGTIAKPGRGEGAGRGDAHKNRAGKPAKPRAATGTYHAGGSADRDGAGTTRNRRRDCI